jgi:hypothetical protein
MVKLNLAPRRVCEVHSIGMTLPSVKTALLSTQAQYEAWHRENSTLWCCLRRLLVGFGYHRLG